MRIRSYAAPTVTHVTTHVFEERTTAPHLKISAATGFSKAVPNLLPADVKLGFNRLSPPDQIALAATADAVSCLMSENLPDERGVALMLAVGLNAPPRSCPSCPISVYLLIRHIIKATTAPRRRTSCRDSHRNRSTPYLVADQDVGKYALSYSGRSAQVVKDWRR